MPNVSLLGKSQVQTSVVTTKASVNYNPRPPVRSAKK